MILLLFLLFFLSGAAALVYQVTWVRSLSLVFGGTHLAVATVLTVFMGGLALGSRLLGRRADRSSRPLRLYGVLELGIGACGLAFLVLTDLYPSIYLPLARAVGEHAAALTALRVVLTASALIVPTTLMGGTLPVLVRASLEHGGGLQLRIALLYAVNTLGAVAGVLGAGFVLLRNLGVDATALVAVAINVAVGATALLMSAGSRVVEMAPVTAGEDSPAEPATDLGLERLALWGIAVGGLCALGYEVLWTRTLTMVVGTSAYSFAIMLATFLTGMTLGSAACGAWLASARSSRAGGRRRVAALGIVEIGMGAAALTATALMARLPEQAIWLQGVLAGESAAGSAARNWATALIASAHILVPAFLSGAAFPLAAGIVAAGRRRVGAGIGDASAYNTVGAIIGSAVSGYFLLQVYGIERSLLLLGTLNVGMGAVLVCGTVGRRAARIAAIAAAAVVVLLATGAGGHLLWDPRYFAIFANNQRELFESRARIARGLEIVDILYYHEGINETISVVRPLGGDQAFIVNGRSEATTVSADAQCQRALGHVPMLLHPDPRRVFVLGAGSGMTLGAVTRHPEAQSVTLAEIEPHVLPATRTFGDWNHRALDDPRVRVVFNDGRNFLATTNERFDVITADPIHPWSGGAAYLYTTEYFRLAASRLRPGGIVAQWLPLYELTPRDVGTVVRTFTENFAHVLVWVTWWDAELIGSNEPFVADDAALERRAASGAVAADLAAVNMAGPGGVMSYCLTGTAGARAFAEETGGVINTDDNLFLEFSAPLSIGDPGLMARNMAALMGHRDRDREAGRLADRAHVLALGGMTGQPEFRALLQRLDEKYPGYALASYLSREAAAVRGATPRPLVAERFYVTGPDGSLRTLDPTAVAMRPSENWAVVAIVDPATRQVYGEVYLDGEPDALDREEQACARDLLAALRDAWGARFTAAGGPPSESQAGEFLRDALRTRAPAWDRRLQRTN